MKHFVYILIFIIGLNFTTSAQNRPSSGDDDVKILKLYPMPATSYINIDFVNGYDKSLSLQIFNFTGNLVYELQRPTPKNYVALNNFTRGFYYYQLRDKTGKVIETSRFLVIK